MTQPDMGLAAPENFLRPPPRRADVATLVCVFVVLQFLIPAKFVISGVPLSLTPASVVALLIGLLWGCTQLTSTLGAAKGRNAVRTLLFLYACSTLATYGSATLGYLPSDELNLADHAIVLMFASVGLALGVCDGVRGMERIEVVLKVLVVAGAMVGVVAIMQYFLDFNLDSIMKIPGLRAQSAGGFVIERSALRRVAGTTAHPIELGVVCAMLLPVATHLAMTARRRLQQALPWWLCCGLIAIALMFSVSRSAIVSFAAAGVVMFIGWPARRRLVALAICVCFLGLIRIAAPSLIGTIFGLFANASSDSSVAYRTHDYATAASEISKHFWLGRGMGTWYAPKHQVFDNQYLLSFVDIGALGLVTSIGIFVAGIYAAIRGRMLSGNPDDRNLGLTLAAMLAVPLVGCATFDLASFPTASAMAFLISGVAGAFLRAVKERRTYSGLSASLRMASP